MEKIAVLVGKKYFIHGTYTCNNCIPKDSCIRNGIDEAIETDLFNEIEYK